MSNGLIYLAAPYSHPSPFVRKRRAYFISGIAAQLACQGLLVFSPISHGHAIHENGRRKPTYKYWMDLSLEILSRCDRLYVALMPGWSQSAGVNLEIMKAAELRIPTLFLNTKTLQTEEVLSISKGEDGDVMFERVK